MRACAPSISTPRDDVRLCYVTLGWSAHDDRFVNAWRAGGLTVDVVSLDRRAEDLAHPSWAALGERLAGSAPDLVQAGPLTFVAEGVRTVWSGPLLATSWGYDLLHDLPAGGKRAASVEAAVAGATLLLIDSDPGRDAALGLGIEPDRLVQFPWGVDLQRFTPHGPDEREKFGFAADEVVVLTTRRHEPIYSVDTVVDAFLAAAPARSELRLLIVGSGSMTEALAGRAMRSGVGERIVFAGAVDNAELPDVYRTADLYVSTSLTDGTSISLLEAMASGVPAVVTDIAGNRPWADEGAVDLFPVGDV